MAGVLCHHVARLCQATEAVEILCWWNTSSWWEGMCSVGWSYFSFRWGLVGWVLWGWGFFGVFGFITLNQKQADTGEPGMSRQAACHLTSTLMIHLWLFYSSALMLLQDIKFPSSNPTPNPSYSKSHSVMRRISFTSCCIKCLILYTEHRTASRSLRCFLIPAGTSALSWGCRLKSSQCRRGIARLLQTVWVLFQLCYGKK